jgi:DNA-binding NarL/FixJ family response regulator
MNATNGATDHIRVFLVDDHPAILVSIQDQIEETLDIEVCGTAKSSTKSFPEIEEQQPDVVVVDISLEDGHGLDLVQNVQAQYPDIQMIVFSMYDEKVYAERAIRMGASGYLMKNEPLDELLSGIRAVNEGEVYLSDEMASRILNKVARGGSTEAGFLIDELTDRELAVFQMLGEGHSIAEIQDRLNIARKTVEAYRRRAKEKLGFDSVTELLQYAVQWATAPGDGDRSANVSENVGSESTSS